jgi:hypothetical protein
MHDVMITIIITSTITMLCGCMSTSMCLRSRIINQYTKQHASLLILYYQPQTTHQISY